MGGDTSTAINDGDSPVIPHGIALHQNYPNPFNGKTTIKYSVSARSITTFEIFDLLGRRVYSETVIPAQEGINLMNLDLGALPSGIYFGRMSVSNVHSDVIKLMLIK